MKKRTRKKIIKGSMILMASFLFIFLTYYDTLKEEDNISLITYEENKTFTNVKENQIINILESSTGTVVIVNNSKYTNRIIKLLNNVKTVGEIYLYNIKNDETILKLNEKGKVEIVKKPSSTYEKLLNTLGLFAENYQLEENGKIIETKYKKIYTPVVLFVKDGKILLSHYISDEEISDDELKEIYTKGYKIMHNEYNS